MIGAIMGDIAGSLSEFSPIKTKDFEMFGRKAYFTDDTVMTCAVANTLLAFETIDDDEEFKSALVYEMHRLGRLFPDAGYGGRFEQWLITEAKGPYFSYGNGSAMRVSPVGWYAKSLEEAEHIAKLTAEVTHNHPEGIKGAQAVAGLIYLAKTGADIDELEDYAANYYDIDYTVNSIRPTYRFDETCQGSVPEAIECFLEAEDTEDAIRNAVSLGGDADTQACIAGAIAEAHFGLDEDMKETALSYLDTELLDIVEEFCETYVNKA